MKAVCLRARSLGLARPNFRWDDQVRARLLALHADGLSNADIARELGCDRESLRRQYRALGLVPNGRNERFRQKIREAAQRQCEREGVRNIGELRSKVWAQRATAAGWPAELRGREVQILEALIQRGPMTRPEIAAAIGMPWKGSRKSLRGRVNGGSYLAALMRRGLVACAKKARTVKGQGRGRSMNVYVVPLWVLNAWPFSGEKKDVP